MSWRMRGTWNEIESWVGVDEAGKIVGSQLFLEALLEQLTEDSSVLVTPTGPFYEIEGPFDDRGAFLLGQVMLEDRSVSGDPPTFEIPPIPEDAVS